MGGQKEEEGSGNRLALLRHCHRFGKEKEKTINNDGVSGNKEKCDK